MKQGACRQKYLLIDLDTEGNASSWLKENLKASLPMKASTSNISPLNKGFQVQSTRATYKR
jgi:cellulose biosynthesis protein BcsQ